MSFFSWQGAVYCDPDYRRGNAVLSWFHQRTEVYRLWKRQYDKRRYQLQKAGVWRQARARAALKKSYDALVGAIAAPLTYSAEDRGRMSTTMERALSAYNEAGHWCRTCVAALTSRGSTCPACGLTVDAWEVETWLRQAFAEARARLEDLAAPVFQDDPAEDDPMWMIQDEPERTATDGFEQRAATSDAPVYEPFDSADLSDGVETETSMHDPTTAAMRAERDAATERRRNDPHNPERLARQARKAKLFAWFAACEAAEAAGEEPPPYPEETHPNGYVEIMPNGRAAEWRGGRRVPLVPLTNEYLLAEARLDADRVRRDAELEEDRRRFAEGIPFTPLEPEPEYEPAEGDLRMCDGREVEWRGGQWLDLVTGEPAAESSWDVPEAIRQVRARLERADEPVLVRRARPADEDDDDEDEDEEPWEPCALRRGLKRAQRRLG